MPPWTARRNPWYLGSTAGPVGSSQEQHTIGALFPDIVDPAAPGQTVGVLDILAGPILRGSRVVTR